ncbi:MAG: hypothetical protein ABL857_00855 [Rickettsiales bacterium]|jgi:UDP-N-acetylmuramyl pentapeptide phosphotransferase/UDP-N-acetylglucosamine-1-phosphate transferase
MTFFIILSFSTFFISLIGTKFVILALRKRISAPDISLLTGKRKAPPLTNGGIAIIFAIIIGFLGAKVHYTIIFSIFLLTSLHLLDSIITIPKVIKLIVRIIAIFITISILPVPIFTELLPPLFDKILAGSFWLWIIHSFDKLEAVEGLLPIQMISIGLGLSAITILSNTFLSALSIQALVFAMAGVGFLWWNFHPAKILAGQIASVPVGFVAGYLLLLAAIEGYGAEILIIPAYFLADSFITFFKRPFSEKFVNQKKENYTPLYCLRAIRNSNSPKWIVRTITGINMLLIFIMTQTFIYPQMVIFNLIVAYAMVFTQIWLFSQIERGASL